MSFEGRDHFTDRLFRKKLKDLDVGDQGHLWDDISKVLDEEKKSGRFILFPWVVKTVLGLSLISFSLLAAYKIGYQHSKQENSSFPVKEPLTASQSVEESKDRSQSLLQKMGQRKSAQAVPGGVQENTATSSSIVVNDERQEEQEQSAKTPATGNPRWSLLVAGTGEAVKKVMKGSQELGDRSAKANEIMPASESGNPVQIDLSSSQTREGSSPDAKGIENKLSSAETGLLSRNVDAISLLTPRKDLLYRHIKEDPCNMIQRYVKRDKIYLDFYYAPEISKRTIEAVYPESGSYAEKRNMDERFIKAYSAGVRGSYVFRNGLALRTGFNYSEIKERFDYFAGTQIITIIKRDDKNNPIDTVQEEVPLIENIYNRYRFYDIPVVAGYEVDLADFLFSINGGVAINLMASRSGTIYNLDQKSKLDLSNNSVEGKSFFRNQVGLSLVGSFGLNYKLSRGLMLLAEPSVRYYLGSVTTDAYPLKQKYLQFGLIAGLRYQFVR